MSALCFSSAYALKSPKEEPATWQPGRAHFAVMTGAISELYLATQPTGSMGAGFSFSQENTSNRGVMYVMARFNSYSVTGISRSRSCFTEDSSIFSPMPPITSSIIVLS